MANRKHYNLKQMVASGYNSSDHSYIHKFGQIAEAASDQFSTVWDVDDTVYPWASFDTAGTLSVVSDSTDDVNSTGTGAFNIVIEGLDNDYNVVSETILINGETPVAGTVSFKRVYRAYVGAAGSTGNNVGKLSVSKGGVVVVCIRPQLNQTLMAIYTIPAGKTGYLYQVTSTGEKDADFSGYVYARIGGTGLFRAQHVWDVTGGGQYVYNFSFPVRYPEKSDIDIRVLPRDNNRSTTACFDMLLVDDEPDHPDSYGA